MRECNRESVLFLPGWCVLGRLLIWLCVSGLLFFYFGEEGETRVLILFCWLAERKDKATIPD